MFYLVLLLLLLAVIVMPDMVIVMPDMVIVMSDMVMPQLDARHIPLLIKKGACANWQTVGKDGEDGEDGLRRMGSDDNSLAVCSRTNGRLGKANRSGTYPMYTMQRHCVCRLLVVPSKVPNMLHGYGVPNNFYRKRQKERDCLAVCTVVVMYC